jgi:hypothetical protein
MVAGFIYCRFGHMVPALAAIECPYVVTRRYEAGADSGKKQVWSLFLETILIPALTYRQIGPKKHSRFTLARQ